MCSCTVSQRTDLRGALALAFPDCPESVVSRFLELASAATEFVIAQAELVLDKPYGRNHILNTAGGHGLSFAIMNAGYGTSLHRHEWRSELFLVRRGLITLRTESSERVLEPGDIDRSYPGVAHALANRGEVQAEFLEMFSPPLLDDKFRISDPYDRATGRVGVHQ